MEASKLKIDPKHLRFRPMSPSTRANLRRENIKALIRNKPAGTIITLADFAAVTQSQQATVHAMLKTMLKRGVISKTPDERHRNRYSWVVNDDVKAVKPSTPTPTPTPTPTFDIEEKAKEYVWRYNSDSLRDFIKWLNKEEA